VLGLGFVVAFGGWAVPGWARVGAPAKVPRIGYTVVASAKEQTHLTHAFEDGLRELGYVEGRSVVYERRFAGGDQGRLPELAADIVKREVDVTVTGSNPVIAVVQRATYISHSGRAIITMPSASITAPLTSLSQRPPRSVSLRWPSVITATVTISASSTR